jgi:hypothetical protein
MSFCGSFWVVVMYTYEFAPLVLIWYVPQVGFAYIWNNILSREVTQKCLGTMLTREMLNPYALSREKDNNEAWIPGIW